MKGPNMEKIVRACDLRDEGEAMLICRLLDRDSIPYVLRKAEDSPYDGIFRGQAGWGYLEAPRRYAAAILEVATSVRSSRKQPAHG